MIEITKDYVMSVTQNDSHMRMLYTLKTEKSTYYFPDLDHCQEVINKFIEGGFSFEYRIIHFSADHMGNMCAALNSAAGNTQYLDRLTERMPF